MNRLPTFSLTHPQARSPEGVSGEAAASPDFTQANPYGFASASHIASHTESYAVFFFPLPSRRFSCILEEKTTRRSMEAA